MLSLGVPMVLDGRRIRPFAVPAITSLLPGQQTSWVDWTLLSRHADVHRFMRLLIAAV